VSSESSNWELERDAKRIYEMLVNDCRLIDESRAQLLLSSSAVFCREGIIEAVGHHASLSSEGADLFVLVYTGNACDSRAHGLGLDFRNDGSLLDISILDNWKRYVLMSDGDNKTGFSGDIIGDVINQRRTKQVFVIFECPFAVEIAADLRKSLSDDCIYIEVAIPICSKKPPCYYHTLQSSTFSYFLNLVLKLTRFIEGAIPIGEVISRVKRCCQALSSLELVQAGQWIKKNTVVPQVHFVKISCFPDLTESAKHGDISGDDEADGTLQPLIEKYYQWNRHSSRVKICSEAADWVKGVTNVYLRDLKDEGVLEDEVVLEAVIGAMVFSIATIQMATKHEASFPNFFLQAFMLSTSAVDFVHPNIFNLVKDSLLKGALSYYKEALKPYVKEIQLKDFTLTN